MKALMVISIAIIGSVLTQTAAQLPATSQADLQAVVKGNNAFAIDLYHQLCDSPGSLFFSPLSISLALAMTYAGARGHTAQEMAATLHLPPQQANLHSTFSVLRQQLLSGGQGLDYQLSLANRLWGRSELPFLPDFLGTTRDFYGAELAQLDFASDPDLCRRVINDWTAEQTSQKIQELIGPGLINQATALVLTNAIFFVGVWAEPFPPRRTGDERFYHNQDQYVIVPMMHNTGKYPYASLAGVDLLELPYKSGDLSMVILLPQARAGLADLEAELDLAVLREWLGSLAEREVQVGLPKFRLTADFLLADILRDMGMPSAFGDADFSGMSEYASLVLSQVVHQSYVDIYEEGTEAAAATGFTSYGIEKNEGPVTFQADHPFLLLIRDNRTGGIVFMGRVLNPLG
jgi:serpin B